MIIKEYKIFENKLDIEEKKTNLLELAIDTEELELVKFFVDKGAKSEYSLEKSCYDDDIFRYLLSKKEDINQLKGNIRALRDSSVQKALIDYGHENFVRDNVGFNKSLKDDPKYRDIVEMEEEVDKFNM